MAPRSLGIRVWLGGHSSRWHRLRVRRGAMRRRLLGIPSISWLVSVVVVRARPTLRRMLRSVRKFLQDRCCRRRDPLEHRTKTAGLTPEQRAKIEPILEQAKPQMKAAREESRQKMKTIRDNVRSQIRPLLTPAQQQKWDAIQKAREDVRKAREALRQGAGQ